MSTLDNSKGPESKLAYGRKDAAKLLGISTVTLDRLTLRGLLHPSRATRRPIYPHWELVRFLRETTAEVLV
jgi:hypothetical protein